MNRVLQLIAILLCAFWAQPARCYDQRWPDFNVVSTDRGSAGTASYFQGFESPCFGPPYQPGTGELDWVRYYSEVSRVPTGTGGIASRNGFNHAQITPPLPGAPGSNTGAYTRLGGYRNTFGGGFTVELDVYLDLADPRVLSGVNASYGWDASAAVNSQTGSHRRDFIFHAASNTSGQILIGSGTISNFAPRPNLAAGPHYAVTASGWYTLQWVYRDAGNGTLAVDTNLRSGAGTLLWTRTLNDPSDVIATQIGGNRYLWFVFVASDRVAVENVRMNSAVREALHASVPAPGSVVNAGTAYVGSSSQGVLSVQNEGSLRLDLCSCAISGPAASEFSVQTCPNSVEPGASLGLTVSCTPTLPGARSATLTLVTNDSTRGTNFSYPLTCFGVDRGEEALAVPAASAWSMLALVLALLLLGGGWLLVLRR